MSNKRRESLVRVMAGLAILLMIALAAVALTMLQDDGGDLIAESAPFGTETSAAAPPQPTDTAAPTARPPTAIPSPSTVPDLKFGIFPLRHSCDVYTKILARIVEEELRLNIEIVTYEGPTPLFADLAENKIDYTLCYAGIQDRAFLAEHSGYIIVYDNRFVEENDIWMQPVVAARKLVEMRSNQPCFHRLLEEFKFTVKDRYGTVDSWIAENGDSIVEWVDCQ